LRPVNNIELTPITRPDRFPKPVRSLGQANRG
jgi:hypothetical protein